jgi:CubicO group peptidase (beta-lactamase class C family)
LVLKEDRAVLKKGYGLATLDPETEITPATFFCIASVSKQFAAAATLKLAQEGKLSLEDPVSKYFPHFQAGFFDRITLAHLLSHTSGIPMPGPGQTAFSYITPQMWIRIHIWIRSVS